MWLRLKISWLNWWIWNTLYACLMMNSLFLFVYLNKESLSLGLAAWRKVLFSWRARILPRKLGLNRAQKWKGCPQLHQESDQIFFSIPYTCTTILADPTIQLGGMSEVTRSCVWAGRWKIMGMKVGSTLKSRSKSRDQSGEVKGFFSASRGRENWLWRKQGNLKIFPTIQMHNWGL